MAIYRRLKGLLAYMICFCSIFLTGCWDQKIFEKTGFILQLGLELDENGELLYSLTLPVVEEEIEQNIEILSTNGDLLRESRDKIRNVSGKRVEGGKAQQLHFSREIAEKGIGDLLDVFLRSPENPLLANITVVEGSPLEMFQLSLGFMDKTRVAFYVTDLIDDARKRTATPESRIYNFSILQHSRTIDPIATHLRYNDKEIEILGTALFNGDKMVGSLGIVDTGLLHGLMGEKVNFGYYYREENSNDNQKKIKSGAALHIKGAKRKVKIDTSGSTPKIDIKLDLKAALDEYDEAHHLDEPEAEKKLEEKIAKSVKEDCSKLLKYLQEVGSDPIGFGEMIRAKHNEYFKSVDLEKIYPDISLQVDIKVNIQTRGALN